MTTEGGTAGLINSQFYRCKEAVFDDQQSTGLPAHESTPIFCFVAYHLAIKKTVGDGQLLIILTVSDQSTMGAIADGGGVDGDTNDTIADGGRTFGIADKTTGILLRCGNATCYAKVPDGSAVDEEERGGMIFIQIDVNCQRVTITVEGS